MDLWITFGNCVSSCLLTYIMVNGLTMFGKTDPSLHFVLSLAFATFFLRAREGWWRQHHYKLEHYLWKCL
ncbi:hypothetical protein BC829DRAFT_408300 [Chytridium lagenaria]|nr:hypothetical protein BC829DRAFT_408300 [Chytridium lagenaria]